MFSHGRQPTALPKDSKWTIFTSPSSFLRRLWQPTPAFLPGESLWTQELGRIQSMGSQRVGHDWVTNTHTHTSSSLGLRKVSTFVLSRQIVELLAASSVQVSLELWDFWAIRPLWNVVACGKWGKHPTLPFMGPALSQAFLIDGSCEHLE